MNKEAKITITDKVTESQRQSQLFFLHCLKNILAGASQVLVLFPNDEYIHPSKGDFRKDALLLREDSVNVAHDLCLTTARTRYGK